MSGRLLYVDVKWPTPAADAASQRTVQLVAALVELGFAVDFGAMFQPAAFPPSSEAPIELPDLGGGRRLEPTSEDEMVAFAAAHAGDYVAAVLAWTRVAARLLPVLRAANPRLFIVFDTNDVNHVREFRHARVSGNANILRRALAMKQAELAAVAAADCTLAVTDQDATLLRAGAPSARVEVVTLAASPPRHDVPGPERRAGALYLGNYEAAPNVDAAAHLVNDILPAVRAQRPSFRVTLAGAGRRELIAHLHGPAVDVLGYVDDLTALFDRQRIFACPLRIGSGIKGKLLTALALGLAAVATPIAVEGMRLRDGEHCLIADGAAEFAAACLRLDGDDALWRRLQAAGRDFVARHHGLDTVERQVRPIFAPLLAAGTLATR